MDLSDALTITGLGMAVVFSGLLLTAGLIVALGRIDRFFAPTPVTDEAPGAVVAPLPGLILRLQTKEGESVQAGQPLLVMEAMKMENVVPAPHNGTVKKIYVAAGDNVAEGDILVDVPRPEMTTL